MDYKLSELQQKIVSSKKETQEPDYTEDAFGRIQSMLERQPGEVVKNVKFNLTQEEKLAMYYSIVDVIKNGESPDQIAKHILSALDEKLSELEAIAKGKKGIQGPIFRRSE